MSRQSKASSLITQHNIAIAAPVRGLRVPDAAATQASPTGTSGRQYGQADSKPTVRARSSLLCVMIFDRYLNSLPEIQPLKSSWLAERQAKAGAA